MFSLSTTEKDRLGGELELKGMVSVIKDIDGNLQESEGSVEKIQGVL